MSSRTTSGSSATQTTVNKPQTPQMSSGLPHDKIAMRAYHKWMQRGCPQGTDRQDWLEAEAELRAEMSKGGMNSGMPQQRR